jgi:hypothetical protein
MSGDASRSQTVTNPHAVRFVRWPGTVHVRCRTLATFSHLLARPTASDSLGSQAARDSPPRLANHLEYSAIDLEGFFGFVRGLRDGLPGLGIVASAYEPAVTVTQNG